MPVEPDRRTVRLRIEGLVQGVGYRAFVEREVGRLGLDGWVRNRRDGGVEVVLTGPAARIDAMIAACNQGPRDCRVDMVKVLDEPDPVTPGFDVRPTV